MEKPEFQRFHAWRPQNTPCVSQLLTPKLWGHLRALSQPLGSSRWDKLTPVLGEGQGVDDGLAQHGEEQAAAIGAPAPCLWDSATPVTLSVGQCHPSTPSQPREGTAGTGSPGSSWQWRILNQSLKMFLGGNVCSTRGHSGTLGSVWGSRWTLRGQSMARGANGAGKGWERSGGSWGGPDWRRGS